MARRTRNRARRPAITREEIETRIIPARDATPIRSMVLYARNKVGKTRFCASCAKIGPTLIIDCEEGTSSIRKTDAKVYKLTHWEELDEIYWYLKTHPDHGYQFVCIDPITRLGQKCMDFVLAERVSQDLNSDGASPTQQDWGKTAQLLRAAVSKFKDLPGIFLIITAYERRRSTDDEDAEIDYIIGPDTQPAVKGFLLGQMDIIGRLYIKQLESEETGEIIGVERRALFGPHEVYDSGDRSDSLPRIMRRPNMTKVLSYINK